MKSVNWNKWRFMPEVKIWEGVALSLNIAPEEAVKMIVDLGRRVIPNVRRGKVADEFNDRLEVAERCLSRKYPVPYSPASLPLVPLAEFADWCQSVGWGIPPELAEMAGQRKMPGAPPAPVAADPTPAGKPDIAAKQVRKEYTQAAAIDALSLYVKHPDALKNLFSNESRKPELKACRLEGRNKWDLRALFSYMSEHGYLKDEYQKQAGESAFLKSLGTP
jgi:hypothetical protein